MKAVQDVLPPSRPQRKHRTRFSSVATVLWISLTALLTYSLINLSASPRHIRQAYHTNDHQHQRNLEICRSLNAQAGPPASYDPTSRIATGSERHVRGTPPTLLRNAKIWTGARNGTDVVFGDVLLDKGVVVAVGYIPDALVKATESFESLEVVDVGGKWITPGLVDLHSHIGVGSSPELSGASDTNSRKAPILPWLRSIDGLNTHDASYELAIAGGVTTVQVLPGSANNIGGQSFLIKLRPTAQKSTSSLLLEPPNTLYSIDYNGTTNYLPWRHMKHACGENPSRVYSQTRMDSAWNFRSAYNEARKIRDAQDAFCDRVKHGQAADEEAFPENLQWEALVDVLRGRVKLSIHCYEAVDLDAIIRLSNEFQFPIASLHHAGETYLVPDLLKSAWGGTPSIALFASNARKKREAYRSSEFAPKVLSEHKIPVVMKSDHPVINSRYLLYEAQQAHYYGLHPALALGSVTTVPAQASGVGMRVGKVAEGYDADLVVWDSHPLALGATPVQVYIDGIKQLKNPHIMNKPEAFQQVPQVPNWDTEADEAVQYDGTPPLAGRKVGQGRNVRFAGVRSIYSRATDDDIEVLFELGDQPHGMKENGTEVLVRDGAIICIASRDLPCPTSFDADGSGEDEVEVDLVGGSLAPGLTTFGSPIGLVEIRLEPSTNDGSVLDPLTGGVPGIVGGDEAVIRAVDGLQFGGRNTLLAYRAGVTKAITPPSGSGFLLGLSTAFDVGAAHALDGDAVLQETAALHVSVNHAMSVSVSTQIAAIRAFLLGKHDGAWKQVQEGEIPLVVNVESADIMATLISLKADYEASSGRTLRLTFAGASEAHLLAEEIAAAGVSVILTSPRPYPWTWDQRRILQGPPLTRESSLTALLSKNVNVAIGVVDEYNARNTRFDVAWAALDSNGTISRSQAIQLVTTNLDRALGVKTHRFVIPDLVAYEGGGIFEQKSKVRGILSAQRREVVLF